MTSPNIYGLVEAGGTKFIVGIAAGHDDVRTTARIDTTTPGATMQAIIGWFRDQALQHGRFAAIGVASFGPLDIDPASPTWGSITRTTKAGWSHTDIAGPLRAAFACPVGFDTDVNGAALAEYLWGAGRDQKVMLYLTIGTGIGGGAVVDGKLLQGLSHPEMGHIRLPRHPDDRDFAGICPFHGDCLEGLASGPAIKARWGRSLSELGPGHPGHAVVAFYLAETVCTLQAIFEPGRIIFGGGVMATPGLIDAVRHRAATRGREYFSSNAADIVVPPGLGDNSGLLGALALAQASRR